jgi:hypothetical protein
MENTNNIEVKIARCDPYPLIEPQGYVVGFIVYCLKNGKSMYRDVLVSFGELAKAALSESGDTIRDNESDIILDMAYSKIKDSVKAWCDTISSSPAVLGSVYKPKE